MNLSEDHWHRVSPFQSLLLIILISFTGFLFIGPFIGLIFSLPFFEGSIMDLVKSQVDPIGNPAMKLPILITQGTATLIGFIIFPYIYGKQILNLHTSQMFGNTIPSPVIILLTFTIVVVFMGFNSIFIEWNANFTLPESMSGFENWARNIEDKARIFTEYITTFDHSYELLISLLVIAVLPAVGEELVFRGFIQNHLYVLTKNIHLAIWIAAAFFSFFHFQFFGFVPRLLLGALFGYMYVFSGKIIFPMLAHFINNGFTLIMIFFHNKGALDFDIESTDTVPLSGVFISAVITVVLLYLFKMYYIRQNQKAVHE